MMKEWPFADPPNVATFTTCKVLNEDHPRLLVTHDEDDGAWQFLCGTTNEPRDGRIVGGRARISPPEMTFDIVSLWMAEISKLRGRFVSAMQGWRPANDRSLSPPRTWIKSWSRAILPSRQTSVKATQSRLPRRPPLATF